MKTATLPAKLAWFENRDISLTKKEDGTVIGSDGKKYTIESGGWMNRFNDVLCADGVSLCNWSDLNDAIRNLFK